MTEILQRRLIPTWNFREPCDNLKKKADILDTTFSNEFYWIKKHDILIQI